MRLFKKFLLALCLITCTVLSTQAEELYVWRGVETFSPDTPLYFLFDQSDGWYQEFAPGHSVSVKYSGGFGGLYVLFYDTPDAYQIMDNSTGQVIRCGENGFINEYVDLVEAFGYAPTEVTIQALESSLLIRELRMFSEGELPEDVQRWEAAKPGEVDLMLFSTHADDEHLFFAGILPDYGCEREYNTLVVYLTGHPDTNVRRRLELLNGLWAVGIRTYPVIGKFRDLYSDTEARSFYHYAETGASREVLTRYVVEQLRKYKPLVAVGHDLKGEYGHGGHMMYARLLLDALEVENDASVFPDLAEQYGLWQTPKAYLHSYPKNQITLNWDIPLKRFNGMTAYNVSRNLGFNAHGSQVRAFAWYFGGREKASEIPNYSPCEFGLCRSLVGEDVAKNDFFENLSGYREK